MQMPPTSYPAGVFGGFVTDVETTGVIPHVNGIIDIGSVHFATGDEFDGQCRAHPGVLINPAALAINGADEARLTALALPTEKEVITRFDRWVAEREKEPMIAGQNPTFDRDFINFARQRAGIMDEPALLSRRTIDMHSLAIAYALRVGAEIPVKGMNADAIYRLLDMPEEPKPHRGIVGARFETVAICKLLEIEPPQLARQREFVDAHRIRPLTLLEEVDRVETASPQRIADKAGPLVDQVY